MYQRLQSFDKIYGTFFRSQKWNFFFSSRPFWPFGLFWPQDVRDQGGVKTFGAKKLSYRTFVLFDFNLEFEVNLRNGFLSSRL